MARADWLGGAAVGSDAATGVEIRKSTGWMRGRQPWRVFRSAKLCDRHPVEATEAEFAGVVA